MRILIGLLTFESAPILERFWGGFVRSLEAEDAEFDLFWVDNASQSATIGLMEERLRETTCFREVIRQRNEKNEGIVAPRNAMLKHAMRTQQYDWIVLVNDDLVFSGRWLPHVLDAASWHPKNGLITIPDNTTPEAATPKGRVVGCCAGVFWALRPEMVMEIGFIHPKFHWLAQDAEYCARIYDFGWRVVVIDNEHCIQHKHFDHPHKHIETVEWARRDHWLEAMMLHHVSYWPYWRVRVDLPPEEGHVSLGDPRLLTPGDFDFARIDEVSE